MTVGVSDGDRDRIEGEGGGVVCCCLLACWSTRCADSERARLCGCWGIREVRGHTMMKMRCSVIKLRRNWSCERVRGVDMELGDQWEVEVLTALLRTR